MKMNASPIRAPRAVDFRAKLAKDAKKSFWEELPFCLPLRAWRAWREPSGGSPAKSAREEPDDRGEEPDNHEPEQGAEREQPEHVGQRLRQHGDHQF